MIVENAVGGSGNKAIPQYLLHEASENGRSIGKVGLRNAIQTRAAPNNTYTLHLLSI
jgi:hypothetical protein